MITFVDAQSNFRSTGGGGPLNVTKPVGLQVGDLMTATRDDVNLNFPSGFSIFVGGFSTVTLYIAYKYATAGDVAASQFTYNSSFGYSSNCIIAAFRGITPSSAITVSSENIVTNNASPSFPNGVTPAVANSMLLQVIESKDTSDLNSFAITNDDPGGWIEVRQQGGSKATTIAYALRPEITATGAYSAAGAAASTDFRSYLVSLAPAAEGPAHLKTLNGVAKANIKTINGVNIGNIKTFNGVT